MPVVRNYLHPDHADKEKGVVMKRFWILGFLVWLAACTNTGGNAPGFTLSASPPALTVAQGSSGQITVSVTRTGGFAGAVTLELLSPPAGVSGSALTVPEGAASGVMTITASGSAAAGSHSLNVKGTSGSLSGQASFTLTVEGRAERPPSSFELIEEALEQGLIDDETALSYQVFAVFGDERLPEAYRGDDTGLSGASIMRELVATFDALSPDTQAVLQPFLLTPPEAGSWYELRQAETQGLRTTATQWRTLNAQVANVKVWWDHGNFPQDERKAQQMVAALDSTIWPRLTGLMREPLPDCGAACARGGGDTRLDIYLVFLPNIYGYAMPFDPTTPTASYLAVRRTIADQNELFATVAHELMHAIQAAYRIASHSEYEWLMEATATWAEDFVYPAGNTEHGYLLSFFTSLALPLETVDKHRQYGAYLFFFYLHRQFGQPEMVRTMWENASNANSLAAVNAAIPGGFQARWPEFARLNYNNPPVDHYQRWDGIQLFADTKRFQVDRAGSLPLPAEVEHLAAVYLEIDFTNDKLRSIAIDNPFIGNWPTASLQAVVKIAGQDWVVEDWTSVKQKTFCRDRAEEKLERLFLIVSNSDWQSPNKLEAGPITLRAEEECFEIDRIEGPDTIILNGPPGEFDVFWKGKPTFPVQLTSVNVVCELEKGCGGGTKNYDEEANPLGFAYQCFTEGGGDKPLPPAAIVNEITLTDSKGLKTRPFTHTIICRQ
jgi:hypothetical protein